MFQHVPCGKCNFCLTSRSLDWAFRLEWEQKKSTSSKFITLTYADEYIPIDTDGKETLCQRDVQLFLKRMRKFDGARKTSKSKNIRYYYVGEYGEKKGRPHYHLILFNAEMETINAIPEIWPIGGVHIGTVTGPSIGYTCGYIFKRFVYQGAGEKPFSQMSRRPGIGLNYLEKNKLWHKPENQAEYSQAMNRFHVVANGHQRRLPRYFKNKVFTTGDRDAFNALLPEMRQKAYKTEIARLRAFYDDPETSYLRNQPIYHEQITRKQAKNRTL